MYFTKIRIRLPITEEINLSRNLYISVFTGLQIRNFSIEKKQKKATHFREAFHWLTKPRYFLRKYQNNTTDAIIFKQLTNILVFFKVSQCFFSFLLFSY